MGSAGTGNGLISAPLGICVGPDDSVYVADINNNRVQKFTSDGLFVGQWGAYGSEDGYFIYPLSVCVDDQNNVYVADRYRNDIQKFTSEGVFMRKWGREGREASQFSYPEGMVVDTQGRILVSDYWNYRIQRFSPNGQFLGQWGSASKESGWFNQPTGIAIDGQDYVYVAEWFNHRIQKFTPDGQVVSGWSAGNGYYGSGNGEFKFPGGLALDAQGNLYVADTDNHRIQKFSSDGAFVVSWGSQGDGDGQFRSPSGIAVGPDNRVYVVDSWNHRVQFFDTDGGFLGKWGAQGSGDGQFDFRFDDWRGINGIAVDSEGNVYVADIFNYRMQKFSADGRFIRKWGTRGAGEKQFYRPIGVAVDAHDNIYVADGDKDTLQKFTANGEFVVEIGHYGNSVGHLDTPNFLALNSMGDIFVTEGRNNRVQMFSAEIDPGTTLAKAVIVAGGGPYESNTLWDATQLCANYAYRALCFQGYSRDTIYYLSADTDLDLDNDGYVDVDADATRENLQYALQHWSRGASDLFVYLVGHGGAGTFRMGEFQLLDAAVLDSWLDTAQQTLSGVATVLYDGCHSGSFLPYLLPAAGKSRILAASAASGEPAVFQADGGLSFGFQFFAHLFNGAGFYDAFVHGKKSVEGAYDFAQNPQLDANGNGVPNEKEDRETAMTLKIGNETPTAGDIPSIEKVSPDLTLGPGETSALIYAQNVVDADGIQEVFAVIKPPDHVTPSADEPVTDLPTISLYAAGNGWYSGSYGGFTVTGTYSIAVFARDTMGMLSLPSRTTVTVEGSGECINVGTDLSIYVPCAQYNGNSYEFKLAFYPSPPDASGLYWKLDMSTLSGASSSQCIAIGTDLSLALPCVAYNGTAYGVTLRFYGNPADPSGLYWKMDKSTLKVK